MWQFHFISHDKGNELISNINLDSNVAVRVQVGCSAQITTPRSLSHYQPERRITVRLTVVMTTDNGLLN